MTSQKNELLTLALLAALMLLTRTDVHLMGQVVPDASWGIFVLAGLLIGRLYSFAVLAILAWGIDLWVTAGSGNPDIAAYCMTPAYLAMPVAWALLWGAGKWLGQLAGSHQLVFGALILIGAASAAFVVSNVGFYAWSGHFASMSVAEYVGRVARYYPWFVATTAVWFGIGILTYRGATGSWMPLQQGKAG